LSQQRPKPELIRDLPIEQVKFDESNPNEQTKAVSRANQDFLQSFGDFKLVLIDQNNIIVDGHHHVNNNLALGKKTIELVMKCHFNNEAEKKIVRQFINNGPRGFDNKEKQVEELYSIFKSDSLTSFARIMNRSEDSFLQIMKDKPGVFIGDETIPEKNTKSTTKDGQVFKLGSSRVMCGDATNPEQVLKLLESDTPRMIFTDPPYAWEEFAYLKPFFETFQDIEVFIFNNDIGAVKILALYNKYFKGFFILKLHTSLIAYGNQPLVEHRMILHLRKGKSNFKNLRDGFGTVHEAVVMKSGLVKQEKPLDLPRKFIAHYTDPGDLVLDLFGGSGSTLIACQQLGRSALIMEQDPLACDVIIKRWEDLTHEKAELI